MRLRFLRRLIRSGVRVYLACKAINFQPLSGLGNPGKIFHFANHGQAQGPCQDGGMALRATLLHHHARQKRSLYSEQLPHRGFASHQNHRQIG